MNNYNDFLLKSSQSKHKGNRKGSLPSYWVNLDELSKILTDIANSSKLEDKGKQKIDGLIMNVNHNEDTQEITWKTEETYVVLTGIEFFANDVRNIGYTNSFDMYINDVIFFEDIYIKETDEYKRFEVRKLLQPEDKIHFIFKNRDKMIDNMFFNIHYIGDIPIKKYNIICIDINTNNIINQYSFFLIPPNKQTICPPEIEEYISLSECTEIDTETSGDINNIEFYYQKEEQIVEHSYDWICKLYWESYVDLDFHCEIENVGELSFKNKEIDIDGENKGWLDYDYTSWKDTPEIITILGFKDKNAILRVNHYGGNLPADENIVITISKRDKNGDVLVKEYKILGSQLSHKIPINICKINLQENIVEDLI